jgi:hypothetical protein
VHGADDDQPRRLRVAAREQFAAGGFQHAALVAAQPAADLLALLGGQRKFAANLVTRHKCLRPVGEAGDDGHRALGGALGEEALEEFGLH